MERKQLLKELVQVTNYRQAIIELRNFPWDSTDTIYRVSDTELINSLLKFKKANLVEEIEDWANSIECRDDIEFESEKGKLLIERLANPELYGPTKKILKQVFKDSSPY